MQTCVDCGKEQPLVKFGHKLGGEALSCNSCDRARRNSSVKKHQYKMWNSARQRALLAGKEFTITMQDVDWSDNCPVFGYKFKYGKGGDRKTSPSLDRIDNSLGYVPGNVEVISYHANRIKTDASLEELKSFAEYYLTKLSV